MTMIAATPFNAAQTAMKNADPVGTMLGTALKTIPLSHGN